ncbi:hypothetical protein PHYBOEH_009785 [Phytophthora boehmeriae]|uniref:Tyrosinase copper-binding domain-containing protein n=1 Tax=Phytophthora boehmeriae TaxID=109152 RepID=A0A8T1WZT3_9STRA|nr:hypothetical protein PHYBOEH_009785 [Phytophthora boehmeriae]
MTSRNRLLFTQTYMDSGSVAQVVNTCGAPAWYRKWLFGYETMLWSLDLTFSEITLPYWDIFEDAAKRLSTSTQCSGIESCSPILQDFGGCEGEKYSAGDYVVNGVEAVGANFVNSNGAAHACTSSSDCENVTSERRMGH